MLVGRRGNWVQAAPVLLRRELQEGGIGNVVVGVRLDGAAATTPTALGEAILPAGQLLEPLDHFSQLLSFSLLLGVPLFNHCVEFPQPSGNDGDLSSSIDITLSSNAARRNCSAHP